MSTRSAEPTAPNGAAPTPQPIAPALDTLESQAAGLRRLLANVATRERADARRRGNRKTATGQEAHRA